MSLPDELLAIADRISAHALATRERAARLSAAMARADWHGLAADVFDASALGVLHALRHSGIRLDTAADTLRRHAEAVAHTLAHLHTVLGDAEALGHDIGAGITDLFTDPGKLFDDSLSTTGDLAGMAGGVWELVHGS